MIHFYRCQIMFDPVSPQTSLLHLLASASASQRCSPLALTTTVNSPAPSPQLHVMPFLPGRSRAFLPGPPPSAAHAPYTHRICAASPPGGLTGHHHPARHTTAINKHAKSGDLPLLQHAVRVATNDGYVLNAVNYTTIANAHAEHGSPEQAFNVLALMRNKRVRPTNVTLRVAIKACERWRNSYRAIDATVETLRWVSSARVDPCLRSWNLALRCLSRHGAQESIATVLQWMHNGDHVPRPDTWSYNTYISSCKQNHHIQKAIEIFAQMLLRGRDTRPDVVTYNTLLDVAAVSKFPVDPSTGTATSKPFVEAILNSISRQNVTPNLTTETLILRLLCRKGATPEAAFIWRRFTDTLNNPHNNVQVDKKYFDAVITGFSHTGDLNGMHYAFKKMTESHLKPDSLTFRALLLGASNRGDISLARAIVDILHKHGVTLDEYSYTTAISSCARADPPEPESANGFLQQAVERGVHWTPAMINAALSSCSEDTGVAIAMWKNLRSCAHGASRDVLADRMVYDALMRVCGRRGRPDLALRIFYAARKAGHVRGNTSDSRALYNAFRNGTSEGGLDDDVTQNALKKPFLQHLKTECGVLNGLDLPIERIRIRL